MKTRAYNKSRERLVVILSCLAVKFHKWSLKFSQNVYGQDIVTFFK